MIVQPASAHLPYPGLRPFKEEEEPLFFGRSEQAAEILMRISENRFLAVIGSSGSGKSSLVRAKLIPSLRRRKLSGRANWHILIIKPGGDPYGRLAKAILSGAATGESPETVNESLPSDSEGAVDLGLTLAVLRKTEDGLLRAIAEAGIPLEDDILLIVDQFEELFAFRRTQTDQESVASRDDASAFVKMLLTSTQAPTAKVRVIVTMRSDFIGDCEVFLGLPETVSENQFLIPRLDWDQMREAIVKPGTISNQSFKPFTFEEGLVDRIINETGDRPDQLPLMQHALMRTWKNACKRAEKDFAEVRLTASDYRNAGGLDEALDRHADEAIREIERNIKKMDIARRLFLSLCDVSPGNIARRYPRVIEVMVATGTSIQQVYEIVSLFQADDRNFVLSPSNHEFSETSKLDVSHEVLLRQWRRFNNNWLRTEKADVVELRSLEQRERQFREHEAALLSSNDLYRISLWQQRASQGWALRYVESSVWERIIAFIEKSKSENRRLRRYGTVLCAIVILWAIFASVSSVRLAARIRYLETSRDQARAAQSKAEQEIELLKKGTRLPAEEKPLKNEVDVLKHMSK